MLPELHLKLAFPGFGSLEIDGKNDGVTKNFQEITLIFIPSTLCKDNHGWVIRLFRNGNCFLQELKPLAEDEVDEGAGVA